MKHYAVSVTAAAERDLASIADYLARDLGSPRAALDVLNRFEALIGSLEELPSAHPAVRDELLALADYRWAPLGSYLAFYTVDEEEAQVTVERVLHSRRNWQAII